MLINTRTHGVLDYAMGLVLIAVPFVLGFQVDAPESWVPIALGVGAILYSLLTNYELGAIRVLPMPVHLLLDGLSGALLAASPWLFQFSDTVWMPHLILGLAEMAAATLTERTPSFEPSSRIGTHSASRM